MSSVDIHPDGWDLRPEPISDDDVDEQVTLDDLPFWVLRDLDEYSASDLITVKREVYADRCRVAREEARYESSRARWGED